MPSKAALRRGIAWMRRRSHDEQRSWRYLDIINRMIDKPGGRSHRVILLGLFATLPQAKGTVRLDRDARPLLLIEDPETRLASDHAFRRLAPAGICCRCSV
ncbi:YjbD family protein [Klebsiella pneumoniae subsp. pneumoniae]|nr:YjbD family protein [Klebsiella pneumoniae subsp. pneumoniae]